MVQKWLAKSDRDENGNDITVKRHCQDVADLAYTYGLDIGVPYSAYLTGLVHDFGKYSDLFQKLLHGMASGIDHALPGAVLLYQFPEAAVAVACHHDRLIPFSDLQFLLQDLMKGNFVDLSSGKQPSLSGKRELKSALQVFSVDFPDYQKSVQDTFSEISFFRLQDGPDWKKKLYHMLKCRMLYSCQIDADYTISSLNGKRNSNHKISIQNQLVSCFSRLSEKQRVIRLCSTADSQVNLLRNAVFHSCVNFKPDKDMYLLSAPTGSGKSLAMARFSLEQCLLDSSLERILFVLPFLTLTDQMYDLLSDIVDGILLDTSTTEQNVDPEFYHTWNAPCIITTMVQFFGSLFSDRPGDCRKLHRLAHSVIVFDEIQALPNKLSRICMQSLYWLCEEYGCKILLSTATPPGYAQIPELDYEPHVLFDRCSFDFPLSRTGFSIWKDSVPLSYVTEKCLCYKNGCIIVNLRKHAREIYHIWKDRNVKDIYYVTTDLCPDDRTRIIAEIKERQVKGFPVHVVSTQCIEAGVDLDFEKIFRAMAPFSSLIQSAGRQNRNGRYLDDNMVIFYPEPDGQQHSLYPTFSYYHDSEMTGRLLEYISDPWELFDRYYQNLFHEFTEGKRLKESLLSEDYAEFAKASSLIEHSGVQVIVPSGSVYDIIWDAVCRNAVTKKHLAMAAGSMVSVYGMSNVDAYCTPVCIYRHGIRQKTGIYILNESDRGCYDRNTGLDFGKGHDILVL